MKIQDTSVAEIMAASIMVHNDQGFVKSGYGHIEYDNSGNAVREVKDNKSVITTMLEQQTQFTDDQISEATAFIDTINGKMMLKKLTGKLSNFESNVIKSLNQDPTNFAVSIIASLPHSIIVDKKREVVSARLHELKDVSTYFGIKGTRYDINIEILDVKYIQTSAVYMITGIYAGKDIIKFWWRDQPDLSDIITGKTVNITGTVNKHESSRYTGANETMFKKIKLKKIIKTG